MNTKIKEMQEDIELLLPWHAAGTLSRRDAARVEQALANDNELASRYELVREELGEAIRLNESLGAPSARAMKNLFEKIDAEPARKPASTFSLGAWMTSFVAGFSTRTLAYGATAAALAIVLQAGIIAGVVVKEQAKGPTLASAQIEAPVDNGAFVLLRFNPQANAADITKFLLDNKATVIGGPAAGMFRLRVSENQLSQEELAGVVKRMAANPVVGFTVPSAN